MQAPNVPGKVFVINDIPMFSAAHEHRRIP